MSENTSPADDVQFTTTVTHGNAETGTYTSTTHTPIANPDKRTQQQKEQDQRRTFLNKLGVYATFLNSHPGLEKLIRDAMADFKNGNTWTDEKFQMEYAKTKFAQQRSKAEEEFDLGMGGANADTYKKKVDDAKKSLLQTSARMGVPLTDSEAQEQATNIVRSNLSQAEVDVMWATKYTGLTTDSEADQIAGKSLTGTASQIQQSLQDTAHSYGLKIDESFLRQKTAEGLGQGERWSEWLNGQKDYFKEQAKLLYPNAAAQFDAGKSLTDLAEPYFSEAAAMLGMSPDQMDLTDPKWTGFLNGEGGRILSKDEWMRVLRTDPQYGWDSSLNARKEYANLTDELFAAFGMA